MLNLKSNYICALDIGSSKIAAAVSGLQGRRLGPVFVETMPAKGMKKGMVVDSIALVNSLTRLINNLKSKSGINIKAVYANISGQDIGARHSRAVIPLAERGNKVISASDMRKVNEQARILASNLEEEIIHQIPSGYSIDSRANVANPIGLYSHRLESDLYLVCAKLSPVQSLSRAINQAGYDMKGLFFSGLVTSRLVMSGESLKGADIFCDIGSDTTELLFFEDGLLKDIEILALGGDNLTGRLRDELKIPFDLAEDLKRSYGMVGDYLQVDEAKEILIKKSDIYRPIKQKLVLEILTQEARAVAEAIRAAVDKKMEAGRVNNFVTVGRTVLLEGFLETLENALGIPVKLGRPAQGFFTSQDDALSGQKYLNYITCLAIISEVLKGMRGEPLPAIPAHQGLVLRALARCREVYQEYF